VGQGGNESRITVCLGLPAIAGISHASNKKDKRRVDDWAIRKL